MDLETFSESDLQSKKYGQLLCIVKSMGLRGTNSAGKRKKTDKLVKLILKAQSSKSLSEDASAVVAALDESFSCISKQESSEPVQEKKVIEVDVPIPSDELLSDIQFPEDLDDEGVPEVESQPKEESGNVEASKDGPRSKRRHTRTFEVEEDGEKSTVIEKETMGKRSRTGTYEVDEDGEDGEKSTVIEKETMGKRSRTGTYEVDEDGNSEVTASKPKRRRTSTFEVDDASAGGPSEDVDSKEVQENSDQLQALTKRLSDTKQQQLTSKSPSVAVDESETRKSRSRSFVIDKTDEGAPPPASQTPKLNQTKERRKSVVAVPSTMTPKLIGTAERRNIRSAILNSTSKSALASGKLASGTPTSKKKDLPASKIMKPLFNVGRGDSAVKEGKDGSRLPGTGIPRFVSFARKLKVPNFAKIHERAFNRMEALDEYVDKKRKMGTPLSEIKRSRQRPASGEIFKPAVTSVENLNLNFTAAAKTGMTPVSKASKEKPSSTKSPQTTSKNALSKSVKKSPKIPAPSKSAKKSPKIPAPSKSAKKLPQNSALSKSAKMAPKNPALSKSVKKSPKNPALSKSVLKSPKNPVLSKSVKKSPKNPTLSKSVKKSPKPSGRPSNVRLRSPKVLVKKSPVAGNHSKQLAPITESARKSPFTNKVSPQALYSTLPNPRKENVIPRRASLASPAPSKWMSADIPPNTPGSIHKRREYDPKVNANKPLNYVPYKGALKPLNTAAIRKTMAEKLPQVRTTKERREDQKRILKGVRFNKRFELQMAKRGIDITQ